MCTIYTDTKTYMLERSSILLTQNLKRKKNISNNIKNVKKCVRIGGTRHVDLGRVERL